MKAIRKFKKALLVVDVQNDFCPGGALGIKGGHRIIPPINKYIAIFCARGLPIILTRDWHPSRTRHFKKFGGVWPVHCLKQTKGARFHSGLKIPRRAIRVYKGMDFGKDSYSAFHAEDKKGRGLAEILKRLGIRELFIAGLATDYCVRFTCHDALKKGFQVKVLIDAIKGVDLKPDDSRRAIKEMIKSGAEKVSLKKIKERLCR